MTSAGATTPTSTWAPLRSPVYRALWIAQLVSNLGTWMQTVGAQWMLVGDPRADVLVPLVQTATTLPVMLLALPSGVLADLIDRRRLLIATTTHYGKRPGTARPFPFYRTRQAAAGSPCESQRYRLFWRAPQ